MCFESAKAGFRAQHRLDDPPSYPSAWLPSLQSRFVSPGKVIVALLLTPPSANAFGVLACLLQFAIAVPRGSA